MDYDGFLNRWENADAPLSIDWDGEYGPQCVDEIAEYCVENGKPVAYANAVDWFENSALTGAFQSVPNDPSNYNQVPNRGDIIIWSGDLPGSEGYGHIAIFDMVTGAGSFQSLDQNWHGQYVHFVQHNWSYVLGWLTPIASQPVASTVSASPAPVAAPDPGPVAAPILPVETPAAPVAAPVEAPALTYVQAAVASTAVVSPVVAQTPPVVVVGPIVPEVDKKSVLETALTRAFHTFWQSFVAAFIVSASGLTATVLSVHNISDAKAAGLALVVAVGGAALSALRNTLNKNQDLK